MSRRVAVGWLASAGLALACGAEEPPATVGLELLAEGADQVMVSVQHYMTREGIRRATVRADTAYVMDDEATIELRHVHLVFFDNEGVEESVLTADAGSYHMQSGDMDAAGNVIVVQSDGVQRLETEQLAYDAAADRLRSETPFVFTQPDRVIRGSAFSSDPSLENREVQEFSAVTDVDEQ